MSVQRVWSLRNKYIENIFYIEISVIIMYFGKNIAEKVCLI